jgi:hypothetical protein
VRGQAVGAIRFDATGRPELRWRPLPVLWLPLAFLAAASGLTYLAIEEGEPEGLIGLPVVAAFLGFVGWLQWLNARAALRGLILPRLAEVLRERVAVR